METDIDNIIDHLLEQCAKNPHVGPNDKFEFIRFDARYMIAIADYAKSLLAYNDPPLLEISHPITIVGDIHGQYNDLNRIFEQGGPPHENKYLFLGDYVDRGTNSIECFVKLLCLKCKYPRNVYLLRGNHETREMTASYGFQKECCDRYSEVIYESFLNVFEYLPLAAVVGGAIFCVHGGLSRYLKTKEDILKLRYPIAVPERGFIHDLMWADPDPSIVGFFQSTRGTSYVFGPDVVDSFLERNQYTFVCRSHQVAQEGYDFPFYPAQNIVTIFSAPNYCNALGNRAAIMKVSAEFGCDFVFIEPELPPVASVTGAAPGAPVPPPSDEQPGNDVAPQEYKSGTETADQVDAEISHEEETTANKRQDEDRAVAETADNPVENNDISNDNQPDPEVENVADSPPDPSDKPTDNDTPLPKNNAEHTEDAPGVDGVDTE